MNQGINKYLLTAEKLMLKLHLKQSGYTHSAYEPFTKHCEPIQKSEKNRQFKTFT